MKTTNYLQQTFSQFVAALTVGKNFFLATIYDTIFWLLFFALSYGTSWFIKKEAQLLTLINFKALGTPAVQANIGLLKAFLIKSAIYLVIFFFIMLIIYTIIKGLIWLTLSEKNPTKQFFHLFFKVHLIWWIIWTLITIFILAGVQPELKRHAVIISFFLYLHFTTLLQITCVKKHTIKDVFTNTFTLGVGKIHYLIIPYALTIGVYLLLTRILLLLPPRTTSLITTAFIIALVSITWFRNYVRIVTEDLYFK